MPQPARTTTSCIWPRTCSGCRRRRRGRTFRPMPSSLASEADRRGDGRDRGGESRPERRPAQGLYNRPALDKVMLGEVIDLVSGIAMGEQGDKAKDILGRVYEYFLLHCVRMERSAGLITSQGTIKTSGFDFR